MAWRNGLNRRVVLAAGLASTSQALAQPAGPPMDSIEPVLARQVAAGKAVGYVAAVIDGPAPRILVAGQSGAADGRPLDGDTVFEIGSVTKLFTALLLADMARRGEVALTDPVAELLPPDGRPRTFDGVPITLLDLVTHTSGLPRLPANLRPADMANPYADYTVAQLYQAVATEPLLAAPGSRFLYSNFAYGVLGHALSLRAGQPFEALVASRICGPLGMGDTRSTLTPSMRQRLAPGHDAARRPVPGWDVPSMPGLGGLRSTALDLSKLLAACQGRRDSHLSAAMASLLAVRRPAAPGLDAAEGWFVQDWRGDEVVWKNGGTGGYASFLGYSTRSQRGVALLSNTAAYDPCTMVGLHLVNAAFPVSQGR